jgi:hypothetical protein
MSKNISHYIKKPIGKACRKMRFTTFRFVIMMDAATGIRVSGEVGFSLQFQVCNLTPTG